MDEEERLAEAFKEVVHRFYEIRQQSLEEDIEDASWEDKCGCLLHDSSECGLSAILRKHPPLSALNDRNRRGYTLHYDFASEERFQNRIQCGLSAILRKHPPLSALKVNQASRQGKSLGEIAVKRTLQEKDGRLKNLLKTSYLRRWIGI